LQRKPGLPAAVADDDLARFFVDDGDHVFLWP
jgi:hypothetical protein